MRACRLLVACILLASVSPVRADLDQALDLVEQGHAALKDSRAADAVVSFRQALEAEEGCVPARYGLGVALLATDDPQGAIVAFRQVVRATGPDAAVSVAWLAYGPKAAKQLERHDKEGQELERLVDAHVRNVMRVAVKHVTKDPDLAVRALQVALTLRPEHKRGQELLARLSAKGARRIAIFDGKQIEDWDGGRGQWWSVEDGVIVGETEGVATFVRNQEEIKGDFDVVMEARIAKGYDGSPYLALMASWRSESDHSRFGTLADAVTWYEHRTEEDKERVFRCDASRLKKPLDASTWTVYELRYRGDTIHALINGREVHRMPRPETRQGGYVGILAQECRAEVRRLDVLVR